jgi:hypothetical protein
MIRHTTQSDWILIPQNAHAESCAVMAEHLDANVVGIPSKRGVLGITLHDSGWPMHDDQPTLDAGGQPTHVFQTPASITTQLWTASAIRASQRDPYAGLLASVHGLHLVAFALQTPRDRQTEFEFNKFQHAQVEFQETIRRKIGMRTDQPMQNGLAKPGIDPAEDELIRDYRTLRALDQISLAALCSETHFDHVMFASRSGAMGPTRVDLQRAGDFSLKLSPWPFLLSHVDISVPAKRIARQPFADESAFRALYASTPVQRIEFHLSRL